MSHWHSQPDLICKVNSDCALDFLEFKAVAENVETEKRERPLTPVEVSTHALVVNGLFHRGSTLPLQRKFLLSGKGG